MIDEFEEDVSKVKNNEKKIKKQPLPPPPNKVTIEK